MIKQRRIVCAANRFRFTGEIVTGLRHYDEIMCKQIQASESGGDSMDQGFVDQDRVFLTRSEGWKVAEAAGQILYRCGGDDANGGTLYSENLY